MDGWMDGWMSDHYFPSNPYIDSTIVLPDNDIIFLGLSNN